MFYTPVSLIGWSAWLLLAPASVPSGPFFVAARDNLAPLASDACDRPVPALPPWIDLEQGLEPIVRTALVYSPRFRQQCRVLAAAPRLRAAIRVELGPMRRGARAQTIARRDARGGLAAEIVIWSAADLPELLAHELEHLIEQLDGVDLRAQTIDGKARQLANGAFETRRAEEAGRQVAGEVLQHAPDRVLRAGAAVGRMLMRIVKRR
jgi:hypothetical protein